MLSQKVKACVQTGLSRVFPNTDRLKEEQIDGHMDRQTDVSNTGQLLIRVIDRQVGGQTD